MCSILGLINLQSQYVDIADVNLIKTLNMKMVHRGPDMEGVVSVGRAILASNRLSIIDIGEEGRMPMKYKNSDSWIVFNGEIYNYLEIREQLVELGESFSSKTDTEVLLSALKHWGEAALDKLRGMFSIVFFDAEKDVLIIARDRIGKKPLYYVLNEEKFIFSSEIKALINFSSGFNENPLSEWSLYRQTDFNKGSQLLKDVNVLSPGAYLKIQGGKVGCENYYYYLKDEVVSHKYNRINKLGRKYAVDELEHLLTESVRLRLKGDTKIGAICSGGVDSGLLTAIASNFNPSLKAFNVSVQGEKAEDESEYAKLIADSCGIELKTLRVGKREFCENIVRATYFMDQPLAHPSSVFHLLNYEFARKNGVKVLLTGEGADELFGGYGYRYRRMKNYRFLQKFTGVLSQSLKNFFSEVGYSIDNIPVSRFIGYDGLKSHIYDFIDKGRRKESELDCYHAYDFLQNDTEQLISGQMLHDLSDFIQPLLQRLDRMSMASSVECRSPFLDNSVVKYALNVPLSFKLGALNDKWILKKVAARHIPKKAIYRKKMGFSLPIEEYIEPIFNLGFFENGFCQSCLNISEKRMTLMISDWRVNADVLFNFLALEIWGRLFIFKQPPDQVNDLLLSDTNFGFN